MSRNYVCVVRNCFNTSLKDNLPRFQIPTDEKVRRKWAEFACVNPNHFYDNTRMCGIHFAADAFQGPRRLRRKAIPSLHAPKKQENDSCPEHFIKKEDLDNEKTEKEFNFALVFKEEEVDVGREEDLSTAQFNDFTLYNGAKKMTVEEEEEEEIETKPFAVVDVMPFIEDEEEREEQYHTWVGGTETSRHYEGCINEIPKLCEELSVENRFNFNNPEDNKAANEWETSSVDGSQYECDVCGKFYREQFLFEVHRRTHFGGKPFQCETCFKSFSKLGVFKRHVRVHTQERSLKCEICMKDFNEVRKLKYHMRNHTGEMPFECLLCSKKFKFASYGKVHALTHFGKIFKCSICERQYSFASSLKVHMTTHFEEKPLLCEFCGERFRHRESFARHLRTHTGLRSSCV